MLGWLNLGKLKRRSFQKEEKKTEKDVCFEPFPCLFGQVRVGGANSRCRTTLKRTSSAILGGHSFEEIPLNKRSLSNWLTEYEMTLCSFKPRQAGEVVILPTVISRGITSV